MSNSKLSHDSSPKLRPLVVQWIRVLLIGLLLYCLPSPRTDQSTDPTVPPAIDLDQAASALGVVPSDDPDQTKPVLRLSEQANGASLWTLSDQADQVVGYVARTLPAGAKAIGYRGPTEAAFVMDTKLKVVQAVLLRSDDTPEHVQEVRDQPNFFQQFQGLALGEVSDSFQVSGVSGATLTSLAMAKGILLRLGGDRPSLFFPDDIDMQELKSWKIKPDELMAAKDSNRLWRTGVLSDDIVGYQGPSELAVLMDNDDRVRKVKLIRSFDNSPYVGYVKDDRYYWEPFIGKTLAEVARVDLVAEGIEGISGATMTSVAAAETMVAAAKKSLEPVAAPKPDTVAIRWSIHELSTLVMVIVAATSVLAKAFRHRLVRTAWLVLVVVVIGFWTGNLISLALIAGWSMEGIAWQLAPGLAALGLVALIAPPLTKGNPYCNHFCPHGALQQLVRPANKSKRRWTIPKKLENGLVWFPGCLLCVAYLTVLLRPNVNLASWEPFHAYLIQIASWSSIGIAVSGLVISSFVPMAYCRYGCATGRLLDYLRLTGKSHRFRFADAVLLVLGVIGVSIRFAATYNSW